MNESVEKKYMGYKRTISEKLLAEKQSRHNDKELIELVRLLNDEKKTNNEKGRYYCEDNKLYHIDDKNRIIHHDRNNFVIEE